LGNKNLLLALAVVYSCGITTMFFVSPSGLPRISFSAMDKVVHGSVFFLLVCIWQLYALQQNGGKLAWRNSFKILLWSLFYGMVIEVFQGVFTETRSADVFDVVANLAGSLVGVVFFQKIKPIFAT